MVNKYGDKKLEKKIMSKPIVTISVPAFKRADMIEDLIKSYLVQTYENSELLIVDDCVTDCEVEILVKKYQLVDSRIRFIKNKSNMGYCKNFLKTLIEARGEYIIILGDDDIFLKEEAVAKYVEIFEKYPDVGFVHTNTMQFNENCKMDYAYKTFRKDILYQTLEESLENIWLKSIHIAGIGLRKDKRFEELYPKSYMLFPQVELIGKLLGTCKSFGIAEFLVGVRAHSAQLGFYAAKGQRIKKQEKFGPVEMYQIIETLVKYYKFDLGIESDVDTKLLYGKLIEFFTQILPTEKINSGNLAVSKTFFDSIRMRTPFSSNAYYFLYFIMAICFPRNVLFSLKEWRKRQIMMRHFEKERINFNKFIMKAGIIYNE